MKTCEILICAALAFAGFTEQVQSEERYTQNMTVAFSNPEIPGILEITGGEGDITVTGYDGKDVILDITTSDQEALPKEDEKAKGMRRISGSSFNITKDNEENKITITRSLHSTMDIKIKVPRRTSLTIGMNKNEKNIYVDPLRKQTGENIDREINDLSAYLSVIQNQVNVLSIYGSGGIFEGNITVEGISGDTVVRTHEGNIVLRDVSGGVTVNTMSGDITATFRKINQKPADTGNPLALSTTDGDIDVTLPADVKATVTAKNVEGDIYTDYDIEIVPTITEKKSVRVEKNKSIGIFTMPFFGNSITGKVNGGGSDILLTAFDGNIYIRKGK